MSDDGVGCCPAGFLVEGRDEKDVAVSSGRRSDSEAWSQWVLSDLRRRHLPPVVGGGLSASKRNARHPILILIVAGCSSQPVVLQVMARRAPAEPKFGMQHCRGPDRRTTVAVGFIRSTVLFAARSVMMGGRNELTAGGGGRKTGRGASMLGDSRERIAAMCDSPGDV